MHTQIFHKHIGLWAKSTSKIAFLIESSPDFIKTARDGSTMALAIDPQTYIGMHMSLPLFAFNNRYNIGAIDFIEFDLRSNMIMAPIQFIINLIDFIERATNFNIIGAKISDFPESVYKATKEILEDPIRSTQLLKVCKKTRFRDYLKSLDQIISKVKISEPEAYDKLIHLKGKFLKLCKTNHWKPYNFIGKCFSELLLEGHLNDFFEKVLPIFQDINLLIGDIGTLSSLKRALEKYDFILFFGGQLHANACNEYLEKLQFNRELTITKDSFADKSIEELYLSPKELDDSLSLFTEKVIDKETISSMSVLCNACKKAEIIANDFKQCSRCKKVRYCSQECQRQDWKEHKLHCQAP